MTRKRWMLALMLAAAGAWCAFAQDVAPPEDSQPAANPQAAKQQDRDEDRPAPGQPRRGRGRFGGPIALRLFS